MILISSIVLLIGIILCVYGFYKIKNLKEIDKTTEEKNRKILESYNESILKQQNLIDKLNLLSHQEQEKKRSVDELSDLTKNMNERAAGAFEQYVDALETAYRQKEEEFSNQMNILDESYDNAQQQYISETEDMKSQLENLKATRAAAMEAQRKEQEIKDNKKFYAIELSKNDLEDVKVLERVKKQLYQPRILSMLIWKTYYQKSMTSLCSRILGFGTKMGIYKITNQLNGMCYIGQSVDIDRRWKDHAKCGLGIDTPVGNKLYKAMQEDGLYNFTFELLEECNRDKLNEKEKFYIELYQSNDFGYNSTGGNK